MMAEAFAVQVALSLRRATVDDAELIHAWRGEPSTSRYQPMRSLSLGAVRARLARRAAPAIAPTAEGELQWVVETPDGPAGWVTVTITSRDHGTGTLGYTIGERLRGRGLATAAVRAILPIAFGDLALDLARFEAVAAVANAASRTVLERNGFQLEGIARGYLVIAGQRIDHARYALLRTEWDAAGRTATSLAPAGPSDAHRSAAEG